MDILRMRWGVSGSELLGNVDLFNGNGSALHV